MNDATLRWQPTQAVTTAEVAAVRALFSEYAAALGIELCFQGFAQELAELPGRYAPSVGGRLLLARSQGVAAGGVGLRDLGDGTAEIKRLYVRPAYRSQGLGRRLVQVLIEQAQVIGYRRLVLDTLVSMTEARRLYADFGFRETSAYYPNPLPDVTYLERWLVI
jgi:ribosomal protein S18 acetylase RimI-like enzyme